MASKGTRVSQKEKEKMWQLFQELGSFKKVAKRMRRDPGTVSRYVHEYETAVGITSFYFNSVNS